MAKKKKKNNQQQVQPQQQPQHQGQGQEGQTLSPKERYEKRVAFKQSVATDDDYKTIRMRTPETSETRNFITILDNLMYEIRMSAGGKGSRIKSEDLTKYINRVQVAKDELNLVCAELSRDLNKRYRPPRGYENPLEKRKQQQQGKQQQQQGKQQQQQGKQQPKQSAPAAQAKPAKEVDDKQAKQAKQAAKKATASTQSVPAAAVATQAPVAATA